MEELVKVHYVGRIMTFPHEVVAGLADDLEWKAAFRWNPEPQHYECMHYKALAQLVDELVLYNQIRARMKLPCFFIEKTGFNG